MSEGVFHPLGDELSVSNRAELVQALLSVDFNRGSDKKTSEFRERYALGQYLMTLVSRGFLEFPVKITKRETPDFLWQRGEIQIGVEVTEGTSQEYRRGQAIHRRTTPDEPFDESRFSRTRLPRGGWAGRNSEAEWVDLIIAAALAKTKGYATENKPFDSLELLIYANTPDGGFESSEFAGLRNDLLIALEEQDPNNMIGDVFSDVHIISGSRLVMKAMTCPRLVAPPDGVQWCLRRRDVLMRQLKETGLLQ